MNRIDVVFRMIQGQCIALFPAIAGDMRADTCGSYMRIGQHGSASIDLGRTCRLATRAEYAPLKRELQGALYRYRLRIVSRATGKHRRQRIAELNRHCEAPEYAGNMPPVRPDPFTIAYMICALWSSVDEAGDPLDDGRDINDIAPDTAARMIQECAEFQRVNAVNLALAYEKPGYTVESAGHDFWLTRNGHGVGFWDRDLGEPGDALTKAAGACREADLYVGDDGKVHQ